MPISPYIKYSSTYIIVARVDNREESAEIACTASKMIALSLSGFISKFL